MSQSIIISGESGSKTESNKHLIEYLCGTRGPVGAVEQNILYGKSVFKDEIILLMFFFFR